MSPSIWRWIPHDAVALLARVAMAATFWRSGQTKVEGLSIDLVEGRFMPGWPRLSDSAVALFRDEYRLPLISPQWAAVMAAAAEHVLPVLLLAGLATRLSATGLLAMTAVIQLLVYPGAWPVHGTWAALLLMLMALGPGRWSLDHAWARRRAACPGPADATPWSPSCRWCWPPSSPPPSSPGA